MASPPVSAPNASAASKNATAIAAAKRLATIALQQHNNENAVKYYAAAMSGMIVLFSLFHWSRFLYSRHASKSVKQSGIMKAQVSLARLSRHVANRRLPGFTSIGHALLVATYLVLNLILTVIDMDWTNTLPISKRLGWIAVANLAFITFLALKNTPLAYLTAYSYEALNPLHQVGGYITILYSIIHGITQCVAWYQRKRLDELTEVHQIYAYVAAAAMLIILVSALAARKLRYELFYIIHIAMYMLILITVALHRPDFHEKSIIITIVAAAMWGSDRIFRGARVLWNSINNYATVTPLPHGGTRIVLRRSPSRTIPGTHCFLWIPKIRSIETHPFTIVSATPNSLELVISKYDGFTSDLHEYAKKNPGVSLRASIDGPYGALPNFAKVADKVILVAGGSGASFTFGVAQEMISKVSETSRLSIDFIWAVRDREALSWFSKELAVLQSSPRVSFFLHTTRPPVHDDSDSPSTLTSPVDDEKKHVFPTSTITSSNTNQTSSDTDIEKELASPTQRVIKPWESSSSLNVVTGRPDVEAMIKDVVARADKHDRISIAACGPDQLMWDVRRTASECISVNGPSIELHCEQFGW